MMFKNPPDYWYAVQLVSLVAAIRYLKPAFENRQPNMDYLLLGLDFEKLHDDPRFLEMVDKTNLRPYFNKRYKK